MSNEKHPIRLCFVVCMIYFSARLLIQDSLLTLADLELWGFRDLLRFFTSLVSYRLIDTLIVGMLALCVAMTPTRRAGVYEWAFSGLFSLFYLLGYSFWKTDSWTPLFGRLFCVLFTVLAWMGLTLGMLVFLQWMKVLRRKLSAQTPKLPALFSAHPFLSAWGIILLFYLPFVRSLVSAGLEYDCLFSDRTVFGSAADDRHWPPFSSAMMGIWVWLGKALFDSYEIGVFLLALFQTLVCARSWPTRSWLCDGWVLNRSGG